MRAIQNANENDLANFSRIVLEDKLYSRFFSTYPKTDVNLLEWLSIWMRRGVYRFGKFSFLNKLNEYSYISVFFYGFYF